MINTLSKKRLISKKVGSSETIRNESYENENFVQWLAGLIDADGGLYVTRQGSVSCEISMHEKEIQTLYYIKKHLNGTICPRKDKKAFRWRLSLCKKKTTAISLMNSFNGAFKTERVQKQYNKACELFELFNIQEQPKDLNSQNLSLAAVDLNTAWFSGFFCGEGSFSVNIAAKFQPNISCSQKEKILLYDIKKIFGGDVYYEKSWDGWKWKVDARSVNPDFYTYLQKYPLHNPSKQARLKGLIRFCGYLDRGLHKDPVSQGRLLHYVKVVFQQN